jgi:hypothetical protein
LALPQLVTNRERRLLRGPLLALGFGLPPCREFALLRSEVWTRFQFIVLTVWQ